MCFFLYRYNIDAEYVLVLLMTNIYWRTLTSLMESLLTKVFFASTKLEYETLRSNSVSFGLMTC